MTSVGCHERDERAERIGELHEREGWLDILINNAGVAGVRKAATRNK
jgi:NADP-dependent 3-hydroxy acid dehydrogenase YdfG